MSNLPKFTLLFGIVFMLLGCNNKELQPTHTAVVETTATSLAAPLADTITPEPVNTETNTPSPTLVTQLSPVEAEEKVLSLLENNDGCALPCFWGIVPGVSSWEDTSQFLSPFATTTWGINKVTGAPLYPGIAYFTFAVPEEIAFRGEVELGFWVKDGYIQQIKVAELKGIPYSLGMIMEEYGPPDEIWVTTYKRYVVEPPPFGVSVFYSRKGILISYAVSSSREQNFITGCLEPHIVISMWQVDTEKLQTFFDVSDKFGVNANDPPPLYLPLHKATDVDVETFYKAYRGTTDTICIKTLSTLWPEDY